MIKLNLADRLDPEIALTLNMKERTYKELPNMYSELDSIDSSQEITTIDPMDNIIIFFNATPMTTVFFSLNQYNFIILIIW